MDKPNKEDLQIVLEGYDAKVRESINLWEKTPDEDVEKKDAYYRDVLHYAREANAIIRQLYPHNYDDMCWDI